MSDDSFLIESLSLIRITVQSDGNFNHSLLSFREYITKRQLCDRITRVKKRFDK